VKRLLTALLLSVIGAYQRLISPLLPRRCKYEPTCSAYAVQAIRELGPVRGSIVAGWRLLRCNPLSDGGIDDLEDRTLFRGHPHRHQQGEEARKGSEPDQRLAGAAR
jgi:uncharacterized protein